jgi:DNA-binding GntR family transcriptional regulator
MLKLSRIENQNLSQRIYFEIRNALMNGQYVPGDRLRIAELAESLGTSITPVREAIFRLVSEQALEMTAATAILVPEHTISSVSEIQLIRSLLEGAAAVQAARQVTVSQISRLEKIQALFIKASSTCPKEAAKRNRDFHFELMAAANLPGLNAIVESLWVRMGPLLNVFHAQVPKRNICNEKHPHYIVIDGLKKRDPDIASNAIKSDIQWGERVIIEWMQGRSVSEIYA